MKHTLITGASRGIGFEFARLLAEEGHALVLVARQSDELETLAKTLKEEFRVDVLVIPTDLGKSGAADAIIRALTDRSIEVNCLINNAGFYVKGSFAETTWEHELDLVRLQCVSHTELIKRLLPGMIRSGNGRILNVCSTGSFTPGPFNAVYCASKAFVLSLSEALSEEVKGTGVTVTALCPGGTATSFQDADNQKRSIINPMMDPKRVARLGYRGLMRGRAVVVPGLANQLQVFGIRLLPRKWVRHWAAKIIR